MKLELLDTNPDRNVVEAEYSRLLGFPAGYEPGGRVRELTDWARQWYLEHGNPWVYAREVEAGNDLGKVSIDGVEFSSQRLCDQLREAEANRVFLVAVSAGPACELMARQLWQEGKPDEYFFLEVFGSAVVEHLITITGARFCAWADQRGMAILPHFSPGYSGWDISEQRRLFQLISGGNGNHQHLSDNLAVLETGMLAPKKSLLAVMGITNRLDKVRDLSSLNPCESCFFPRCQYRRAPYKYAVPGIEDVRQLQPVPAERVRNNGAPGQGRLDRNGHYSLNARALKKWSLERLRLRVLDDGSVEARFRYDGTTCSNLGRPLAYEYHIRLAPPTDDYRILETDCSPAAGDTGHTHMCEYLANADQLEQALQSEQPLKGRPLNEVLHWRRSYSPAGCFCDAESRTHKWGLVLEVLHYALVTREVT